MEPSSSPCPVVPQRGSVCKSFRGAGLIFGLLEKAFASTPPFFSNTFRDGYCSDHGGDSYSCAVARDLLHFPEGLNVWSNGQAGVIQSVYLESSGMKLKIFA